MQTISSTVGYSVGTLLIFNMGGDLFQFIHPWLAIFCWFFWFQSNSSGHRFLTCTNLRKRINTLGRLAKQTHNPSAPATGGWRGGGRLTIHYVIPPHPLLKSPPDCTQYYSIYHRSSRANVHIWKK